MQGRPRSQLRGVRSLIGVSLRLRCCCVGKEASEKERSETRPGEGKENLSRTFGTMMRYFYQRQPHGLLPGTVPQQDEVTNTVNRSQAAVAAGVPSGQLR